MSRRISVIVVMYGEYKRTILWANIFVVIILQKELDRPIGAIEVNESNEGDLARNFDLNLFNVLARHSFPP